MVCVCVRGEEIRGNAHTADGLEHGVRTSRRRDSCAHTHPAMHRAWALGKTGCFRAAVRVPGLLAPSSAGPGGCRRWFASSGTQVQWDAARLSLMSDVLASASPHLRARVLKAVEESAPVESPGSDAAASDRVQAQHQQCDFGAEVDRWTMLKQSAVQAAPLPDSTKFMIALTCVGLGCCFAPKNGLEAIGTAIVLVPVCVSFATWVRQDHREMAVEVCSDWTQVWKTVQCLSQDKSRPQLPQWQVACLRRLADSEEHGVVCLMQ